MENGTSQLGRTHEKASIHSLSHCRLDLLFSFYGSECNWRCDCLVCCDGSRRIMRKKALLIYFVISLIVGTSIYIVQQTSFTLPSWINNYVNDFLIIPIILTPSLYLLRWSKNNREYTLPLSIVLYACGLYAVLFEWYFPQILERYTSDIIDVFLYFGSGIVFYGLQKYSK